MPQLAKQGFQQIAMCVKFRVKHIFYGNTLRGTITLYRNKFNESHLHGSQSWDTNYSSSTSMHIPQSRLLGVTV